MISGLRECARAQPPRQVKKTTQIREIGHPPTIHYAMKGYRPWSQAS